MATKMMTTGMTAADRLIAAAMLSGLAVALVQLGQSLALPAHFV